MDRLIVGVMLFVGLCAPVAAQDATVAHGEKVFVDQKCALCHSIGGKGNKKGAARRRGLQADGRRDPRVDRGRKRHDRQDEGARESRR